MSRSGIYDYKHGFIPEDDCPQSSLCDRCMNFPCTDGMSKMLKYCPAYCEIPKPQTNADRIRSMTDEELAREFAKIENDPYNGATIGFWLDWLKEECD